MYTREGTGQGEQELQRSGSKNMVHTSRNIKWVRFAWDAHIHEWVCLLLRTRAGHASSRHGVAYVLWAPDKRVHGGLK